MTLIDFGIELGRLQSSAQLTNLHPAELVGRQVVASSFPPRRIAGFRSDCCLGAISQHEFLLASSSRPRRHSNFGDVIDDQNSVEVA